MSDSIRAGSSVFPKPSPEEFVCQVWLYAESCGGYSAEAVSLPGVASQGETEAEAIANLREAFKGALETYLKAGTPIPCARKPQNRNLPTRRKNGSSCMADRLPCISGKEAIRAFEKLGFVVDRIRSSQHIMKKDGHPYVLTVPVHGSAELKPGVLRSLIRAAGISVSDFCKLLD